MIRNPKIVDLGSGGNPRKDAGVLVDKYEEPLHRGHTTKELKIPENVKFVKADIADLPFEDNEFDFSYCIQVLEHVDDPVKCCNEIMRISKSGYIDCPRFVWELLFGRKYHKWIVSMEKNKLIFTRKTEERCPKNTFRGDRFIVKYPDFKQAFAENRDLFHLRFYWKDKFEVEIRE